MNEESSTQEKIPVLPEDRISDMIQAYTRDKDTGSYKDLRLNIIIIIQTLMERLKAEINEDNARDVLLSYNFNLDRQELRGINPNPKYYTKEFLVFHLPKLRKYFNVSNDTADLINFALSTYLIEIFQIAAKSVNIMMSNNQFADAFKEYHTNMNSKSAKMREFYDSINNSIDLRYHRQLYEFVEKEIATGNEDPVKIEEQYIIQRSRELNQPKEVIKREEGPELKDTINEILSVVKGNSKKLDTIDTKLDTIISAQEREEILQKINILKLSEHEYVTNFKDIIWRICEEKTWSDKKKELWLDEISKYLEDTIPFELRKWERLLKHVEPFLKDIMGEFSTKIFSSGISKLYKFITNR